MHKISVSEEEVRTDLISEMERSLSDEPIDGTKVEEIEREGSHYTTIYFEDITDQDNFKNVQKIFINEIKKYIKIKEEDCFLVIGLGNAKSTPDSLGPATIENILVTRYLFLLGEVEEGYSNVASFTPNVMGNTGIETTDIIKGIIEKTQATKVIVIDALKAKNRNRLGKTIQITNQGISPGSGIGNTRKEISKETVGIDIIAIGVPTVVDIKSLLEEYTDSLSIKENLIVTPTNIDFMIEKLSLLIGNGINISLHKNFIRQKNN